MCKLSYFLLMRRTRTPGRSSHLTRNHVRTTSSWAAVKRSGQKTWREKKGKKAVFLYNSAHESRPKDLTTQKRSHSVSRFIREAKRPVYGGVTKGANRAIKASLTASRFWLSQSLLLIVLKSFKSFHAVVICTHKEGGGEGPPLRYSSTVCVHRRMKYAAQQ